MKIDKLKIKNFYCFVKTELNFSQYQGLTLIKGVNKDNFGSNGSGKSALLEAVFFGLKVSTKITLGPMVRASLLFWRLSFLD